jgi:DNA-binding transcriptional MocR family regulator
VTSAYRVLRDRGFILSGGRRGTTVAPRPAVRLAATDGSGLFAAPGRTQAHDGRRDLASGEPDPVLLPSISGALVSLGDAGYATATPERELLELARASFAADGIDTSAIGIVSGAMDGVERVLSAHLRAGDAVVVEDPVYPPVRDLLLALGLVPAAVAVDDRGLVPAELGRSLRQGVRALVTVPRAQNPYDGPC